MSDSVRPHRRPPTRLLCLWDSPGKNTGVGCHFLLQCMKVKSESEASQSCPTLSDPMDCSLPGPSIHGIFQARVLEWGTIYSPLFLSGLSSLLANKYRFFSPCNLLIEVIRSFVEKALATHSSTLAWKLPWTEEPGGLQSMGH